MVLYLVLRKTKMVWGNISPVPNMEERHTQDTHMRSIYYNPVPPRQEGETLP